MCQNFLPFKKVLFFIWIYLLYIVVLVFSVQKSELAVCIPVFSPSWTSTPLGHLRALNCKLPALISRIPLAICFTHGSAHVNSSLRIHSTTSTPCLPICSLCLCLYSCPEKGFICTIFLNPHICINIWYFIFSFWLPSLGITDYRSIHIITNDPILFLFMYE